MKTVKLTVIIAITGLALLFAACSETENIDESLAMAEKSAKEQIAQGDSCTYEGELTQAEIEGLLLMREEEKLARDVYLYFDELYDIAIFGNIAKSEDVHMTAVLNLLEGYGIDDPASEVVGEFNNEELAKLYAELVSEGQKGLVEALKVGATIEDLDIFDLMELLEKNENEDVERVYTNLLKGSENHMRAFIKTLESLEASYTPQFITADEFAEILAAENTSGEKEKGNKGNGQGNSNGNKRNSNSGSENCDGTGPNS